MSLTLTRGGTRSGGALAALGRRAAALLRRSRDRFADRRAAEQLAQLDDRMLHDIGLARADIEFLARGRRRR